MSCACGTGIAGLAGKTRKRRSAKRRKTGLGGLGRLAIGSKCKSRKTAAKRVCVKWTGGTGGCGNPGKHCTQFVKKTVKVCASFGATKKAGTGVKRATSKKRVSVKRIVVKRVAAPKRVVAKKVALKRVTAKRVSAKRTVARKRVGISRSRKAA